MPNNNNDNSSSSRIKQNIRMAEYSEIQYPKISLIPQEEEEEEGEGEEEETKSGCPVTISKKRMANVGSPLIRPIY